MYFMIKKCFIFEKYVRAKMEIHDARPLDTFSSEVQSEKEQEGGGGSACGTGRACVTSGIRN